MFKHAVELESLEALAYESYVALQNHNAKYNRKFCQHCVFFFVSSTPNCSRCGKSTGALADKAPPNAALAASPTPIAPAEAEHDYMAILRGIFAEHRPVTQHIPAVLRAHFYQL